MFCWTVDQLASQTHHDHHRDDNPSMPNREVQWSQSSVSSVPKAQINTLSFPLCRKLAKTMHQQFQPLAIIICLIQQTNSCGSKMPLSFQFSTNSLIPMQNKVRPLTFVSTVFQLLPVFHHTESIQTFHLSWKSFMSIA